jgi:hypothetical protein
MTGPAPGVEIDIHIENYLYSKNAETVTQFGYRTYHNSICENFKLML